MINNTRYQEQLRDAAESVQVKDCHVLVTGATGLIGSAIIDVLMTANKQGATIHIYALGRSREKLLTRFSSYVDHRFFHLLVQDICTPLPDEITFDYIIHGASNADPVSYAKYPAETMTTNLLGAYNILTYGKNHPTCRITMLSTFEVYGNAQQDTYQEGDAGIIDFNVLRSCYPESKRSVELMAQCYHQEYGVQVNVARLSSIYGPTMLSNDSKAHAQFIRNALAGKEIILKSRGLQKRTYTYVLDAVTGLLAVLYRGISGEAYNVCNGDAITTIAEVAQLVASIAQTSVVFQIPSELEAKGFSKPQNCILVDTKLRNLGWKPRYDLKTGLISTMNILANDL